MRLIRSKGVGVYFVTQNPLDIPETVLGQLGNRVQHALRAFTPRDQKAVKAAAETFRGNPNLDETTAITELAVGEALVSFLDEKGTPGLVERAFVVPPAGQIGPITPEQRAAIIRVLRRGRPLREDDRPRIGLRDPQQEGRAGRFARGRDRASESARSSSVAATKQEAARTRGNQGPARRTDSIFMTFCKSAVRTIGNAFGRIIERGILGSILGGTQAQAVTPGITSCPFPLSSFARGLTAETAFDVLAVARKLQAAGKDVIALQIGDSPFPSTASARSRPARRPSTPARRATARRSGLPEFRETIARTVKAEFGIPATAENVVVGPGAKPFEQFFCEAFLEPGDAVLVFQPAFPTYEPNILRRGAKPVYRPAAPGERLPPRPRRRSSGSSRREPRAKAIFLNSPHNPTGGVATQEDLKAIADLVRGTNIAVFSRRAVLPHGLGGSSTTACSPSRG